MKNLVPWRAKKDLGFFPVSFDDMLDSMFDSVIGTSKERSLFGAPLNPVESYVKEGKQTYKIDVPGIPPNDIEITFKNNMLTVSGERKVANKSDYSEVEYGKFTRAWSVPDGADPDSISAKYENGVLEITLDLPTGSVEKKIEVKTS
jgi:HSP20 family protein